MVIVQFPDNANWTKLMKRIVLGWNRNQWQLIVLWLLLIAFGLSKNVEDTIGMAFLTLPLVIVAICAFASDPKDNEPNYERLAVIDEIHRLEWKIIELEIVLTLIGDIAYDRNGYTGDAEKLGELVDEIYVYARSPSKAVEALGGKQ